MNPAKGVRFTTRKKPQFSSDPPWEYAEEDILQPIAEAPEAGEDPQEHIVKNLSAMLKNNELVKANMSKQKRYESEIVRLGEVINDLRLLALQLMSLVGQPSDGIKYDLFAILDEGKPFYGDGGQGAHGRRTAIGQAGGNFDRIDPRDIRSFKKNIGADVTDRLQKLEASVQSFELASSVGCQ